MSLLSVSAEVNVCCLLFSPDAFGNVNYIVWFRNLVQEEEQLMEEKKRKKDDKKKKEAAQKKVVCVRTDSYVKRFNSLKKTLTLTALF